MDTFQLSRLTAAIERAGEPYLEFLFAPAKGSSAAAP